MIVHKGRWTRDDRAAAPYRALDFDVPPGTEAVTVTLAYDTAAGVVDLGCAGPAGFRGWSGGARSAYGIGRAAATPGYTAGPLEPGGWQVLLGLHRVGPAGLDWEVTVETGRSPVDPPGWAPEPAGPIRPPARPRRDLPAAAGLCWLAGDLHTHSVHSDGVLTLDGLGALAYDRGLDFLAVTDHNTTSHHAFLPGASARTGVVLLPGQEVTTATGHANAYGDIGWIDFRRPADEWLDATERRGGLLSVNHPLAADLAWRQPMTRRPRHAEVWHWSWLDRRWGGPVAWWLAWDPTVIPVGGSDFHRPGADAPPGSPTTWVACDRFRVDGGDTVGAVLDGLRTGRVAVSAGPPAAGAGPGPGSAGRDEPVLLRVGDELVAVAADGLLLSGPDTRRTRVRGDLATFPATPGPHWLEDDDTTIAALTP